MGNLSKQHYDTNNKPAANCEVHGIDTPPQPLLSNRRIHSMTNKIAMLHFPRIWQYFIQLCRVLKLLPRIEARPLHFSPEGCRRSTRPPLYCDPSDDLLERWLREGLWAERRTVNVITKIIILLSRQAITILVVPPTLLHFIISYICSECIGAGLLSSGRLSFVTNPKRSNWNWIK